MTTDLRDILDPNAQIGSRTKVLFKRPDPDPKLCVFMELILDCSSEHYVHV